MRNYIYRVSFMRQSTTRDAVNQLEDVWTEHTSRMANIRTESAREYISRSAQLYEQMTKFYVRRDSVVEGITVRDRIDYNSKEYEITGILDAMNERTGDIIFMCRLTT